MSRFWHKYAIVLAVTLAVMSVATAQQPSPPQPSPAQDKKTTELLDWTREVAEDFLRAVLGGREEAARALLATESRPPLGPVVDVPAPGENPKFKLTDGGVVQVGPSQVPIAKVFHEFTIASSRLAPDQDEAVFRGALKGEREGTFTLRVSKEKTSGKWRVSFLDLAVSGQPAKK